MPAIDVLLPARNAAATLSDALDSVRAQTFRDFRVLVIDDGSTDDTARISGNFGSIDDRFVTLEGHGRGIVDALNLGLTHVTAPLVARFDADDLMHPDRFTVQLHALEADPTLAAVGSRIRCFPDEFVRDGLRRYEAFLNDHLEAESVARVRFVEAPLVHPSVTLRTDVLRGIGGWHDTPWAEDWDLWMRLVDAGHRLAKVPETLHSWRERPDRLTRTDARYSLDAMTQLRAHYLVRGPLAGRRPAVVWGAGPVGKALVKALDAEGALVRAYADVDPRKIGQRVHGRPVLDGRRLVRQPDDVLLAAVGAPGARDEIRGEAVRLGFTEGLDFWCCA